MSVKRFYAKELVGFLEVELEFEKGLTVTTFYLAKGLEFDQVFTAFFHRDNPLYKQAAYISATRALHELFVYQI